MTAPATILACRVALSRNPGDAAAKAVLAQLLLDAGRAGEAEPLLRDLLALDPSRPGLRTALGNAHKRMGRLDEAEASYRIALEADPGDIAARYNLAILCLLQGRLGEGWEGRELRWRAAGVAPRAFCEPEWDGSPLRGRTLLLHGAQEGFGDAIMALRFAAQAKGGRVLVECHPHLAELFRTCPLVDGVIPLGEPLPPFDVQALLMSLPRILRVEKDTIPWPGPYLRAPGAPEALGPGFKVGLVHAGSPAHPDDAARSIPPDRFEVFSSLLPDCAFFSLQKAGAPLPPLPAELRARDLGRALPDFAATARILASLDLLVSVDTSVAHLAGAMGLPVLLLLPFEPDWRWMLEGDTTPWYPSIRLFRQPRPEDWDPALKAAAEAARMARARGIP